MLDKGLKIQHSGSTPFILNEVEGLTTSGSMSLTTGGSMTLTINRTSKVRDSACGERSRTTGSLTSEYLFWLIRRRWRSVFEEVVDCTDNTSEVNHPVTFRICSRSGIARHKAQPLGL